MGFASVANLTPMKRLSVDAVAEKLRALDGNLAAVGRVFGVTRTAVHHYLKTRPSLIAIRDEAREAMKDDAESALSNAVRAGEAWAVCFYLKCQAKDRGYVERQEFTGADGGPVEVREIVVTTRQQADAVLAALSGPESVSR